MKARTVTFLVLCALSVAGCQPYAVQFFTSDVPQPEVTRVENALMDEGLEVVRNPGATPYVAAPTVVYFPGRKSIRAANRSAEVLESLGYRNVRIEPFHLDNHEYSTRTIGIYLRSSTTAVANRALPGVQRASFGGGCDDHDVFLTLLEDGSFHLAIESGIETTAVDECAGHWRILDDEIHLTAEQFEASLRVGTSSAENLFSPGLVRNLSVMSSTAPVLNACRRSFRRLMER